MAKATKQEVIDGVQGVLEGFAVLEVNILRSLSEVQRMREDLMREVWDRFELGERPEWEPEIRVRKVSA